MSYVIQNNFKKVFIKKLNISLIVSLFIKNILLINIISTDNSLNIYFIKSALFKNIYTFVIFYLNFFIKQKKKVNKKSQSVLFFYLKLTKKSSLPYKYELNSCLGVYSFFINKKVFFLKKKNFIFKLIFYFYFYFYFYKFNKINFFINLNYFNFNGLPNIINNSLLFRSNIF